MISASPGFLAAVEVVLGTRELEMSMCWWRRVCYLRLGLGSEI
jgi:hypothetical protein